MSVAALGLSGQQVIWCALVALGMEFLLIAVWIWEDKTFLLIGVHLVLISLIAGIDIWILPDPVQARKTHGEAYFYFWEMAYQALACAYLAATIWMTRMLTHRPDRKAALIQSAVLGMFLLAIAAAPASIQKTLKPLAVAYFLLLIGGLLDFLIVSNDTASNLPSFGEFGVLAIGIIGTYIFSDKMIELYDDNRRSLLKINEINLAMEVDKPLGLIGISATKVSEEIQNQVSILKSYSGRLTETGHSSHHAEIARINSARKGLEKHATGILEFSASSKLGSKSNSGAAAILQAALGMVPPGTKEKIRICGDDDPILADPAKLARALAEILKNSGESGAERIEVRMLQGLGVACFAIEDDGMGCARESLGKIAQPFFTMRKDSGALGLGASIADGIIRSHGGALRFYARPGSDGRMGGLIANVILPKEGPALPGRTEWRGQCALASDRTDIIATVLSICGNLGLQLPVTGAEGGKGLLVSLRSDSIAILEAVDKSISEID